jgi:hypothetical protein
MKSVRTLAMALALMLAGAVTSFADLAEWKKTGFEIVGEHPPPFKAWGNFAPFSLTP